MARFKLELGPIPFYHQVYLDLRAMIDDGRWPVDHRVAPERELAREYGVSLITVRRALDELAREGRLERTRGRGTFVIATRIDRDLDDPLSFTEEMQTRGLDPRTRLISSRPQKATERVATALGIEPGSPTFFVERLRLAGGEPMLLEQVHLPGERLPGLLASDLESGSLYKLLEDRYGIYVVRARETFEPVLLQAREAELLKGKARTPALVIEGVAFAADGSAVEFSRTFVRGDKTRYYVERNVRVVRERGRQRPEGRRTASTVQPIPVTATERGGDQ
ncbi:MAG TPA: GntR family transcriptional regulator [Candidatus Limnocylindrales bacterium]